MLDAIEKVDRNAVLGPQVYNLLRQEIIETHFLPGMLLSETEIGRRYNVSRQPVREAFIRLAQAGLVQVLPQRGTRVSRISEKEIRDSRFLREAIEADIVRAVTRLGDDAVVAELKQQVAAQRRVHKDDLKEFLRLDDLFHRTLAEAAGNSAAWPVLLDLKSQIDRVRYLSLGETHNATLVTQHETIVNGISVGDIDGAERAMRLHLREILHSLSIIAAQNPELVEIHPSSQPLASRD